ncbi:MAG: PKD domain-containing protein [Bacteroidetes bacterium]|nr:MAG: PKD domain-containing protein [Bacteroidota bacterium]
MTDEIATYALKLVARSDYGCIDSTVQNMYVYPRTIAAFSFNDGGCSPFTAYFLNESVRGETYAWDFGDGTGMRTTDPTKVYFNDSGRDATFTVSLTSTSRYGCMDSITDTLVVYAQPYAEFTVSPTHQMYPSSGVMITNYTNQGEWSYHWHMGDGSTSALADPVSHTYGTWGTYTISLNVASEHCSDSVSHAIRILPAIPVAEFDTVHSGCVPLTVQFRNRSVFGNTCLWDFDDGATSTEFEPEHIYTKHGIYNVKLTVTGDGGNEYAYRQVEVYRLPEVDFRVMPDVVMLPDDEIQMYNMSRYGATWLWDFGDGGTSVEESPSHLYTSVGMYDITLDAWTEHGCTGRLVKPALVSVQAEGFIMFPNAFKPDLDGPNGGYYDQNATERNYIFHPYWGGVVEYNLVIYDRWGEQLFYSNDVNIGWDGYHDGKLCKQAVYVFKSWGHFINGELFDEKGDVTLIYHRKY